MAIVTLRTPEVKTVAEKRAENCPYCGSSVLQGWGRVTKVLIDPQVQSVWIRRYRCTVCRRTFRHYPQGITAADQTDRMRFVCALIWKIGASLRGTTALLGVWQRTVCHMTVWRDIQWAAMRRSVKETVRVAGWMVFTPRSRAKTKG
jgi:uncharacterized protein with PIN domain